MRHQIFHQFSDDLFLAGILKNDPFTPHTPANSSPLAPSPNPFQNGPSFTPSNKAFHYQSGTSRPFQVTFTPWWGPFTPVNPPVGWVRGWSAPALFTGHKICSIYCCTECITGITKFGRLSKCECWRCFVAKLKSHTVLLFLDYFSCQIS